MIRINLLAGERKAAKKPASALLVGQKITIGCTSILVVAALFVGWRYWTLNQESARLDKDIADAQQEISRLRAIINQVQDFEKQKTELQQRVALIEDLRKNQTGPVHMLDQVSRALPPSVWLTELKQAPDGITIDGRCTGLTSLSDFVSNLEATGYFKRSIEIVSSQTDTNTTGEVTRFSIKAQFQPPGS
jgi:type IV pilus assembly protein PilN